MEIPSICEAAEPERFIESRWLVAPSAVKVIQSSSMRKDDSSREETRCYAGRLSPGMS